MDSISEASERGYRVPWTPVMMSTLIVLGFFVFLISFIVFILVAEEYGYTYLAYVIFFFLTLFALVFFLRVQFWVNRFDYPVKRWVLENVVCRRCGSKLALCESNMENPWSFLSFVVYCRGCGVVDIIETAGIFGRTLKFASKGCMYSKITSGYRKKYLGEVYGIPRTVWLMDVFFSFVPVLPVLAVVVVPVVFYVHFYGPGDPVAVSVFNFLRPFIFFLLVGFSLAVYWRYEAVRNFSELPLRRWILESIKCPECGGKFARCGVVSSMSRLRFRVHCRLCGGNRLLEVGSFDWLLRFVDE